MKIRKASLTIFFLIQLLSFFESSFSKRSEPFICTDLYRQTVRCSREFNPVCAFSKDGKGRIQQRVALNGCLACVDSSTLYHIEGECETNKVYVANGVSPYQCNGGKFDDEPICGYFTEDCPQGLCPKTLPNVCAAFQDMSIVYYERGACEQETLSCAVALFPRVCPEVWSPVCANAPTLTTFDNLCVACSKGARGLIKPGACEI